jgi:nucleotide-binding universal stress UspA family protein
MGSRHRIVVGYDGSDSANRALDRAAEFTGYGSQLTIVTDARNRLLLRRVFAEEVERVGDPAEELIAVARERHADLLIVGNGKTRLQRLLLGSVSTRIAHHAPCDVLIAR